MTSNSHVSKFKIALITDVLTNHCIRNEASTVQVTPFNHRLLLKLWKPDFLFVESAWQGHRNRWKFKIASYPQYPERSNQQLMKVVGYAKDLGIPTVFWNKEDAVHFDRFIESAKLFDHVFTVDVNCISKYRDVLGSSATVSPLIFAVQPSFHNFLGFNFKYNRANFVGSYSHHIHDRRRAWQNMLFDAAVKSGLGLTIVDRNSERKSANYRYPQNEGMQVLPAIAHNKTANIYKDYLVSLNINTIEDSASMFSRRLVEILACGGIAVTNPAPSVDKYFKDYCHVVHNDEEAIELFQRLKHGPSSLDLERAEAGARYVLENHTWAHRLKEISRVIGLEK